jgi:hypothetical protein
MALALALATITSSRTHAQASRIALTRLQSASYVERRAGFYTLLSTPDSGCISQTTRPLRVCVQEFAAYATRYREVGRRVIALLQRENTHQEELVSEDRYHGDLIAAVAGLHDPSAVDALMGAINTGYIATHGLAMLGDAAVPSVIAAASASRMLTRDAALSTLSDMVTVTPAPTLSSTNRARIRAVMLEALTDSNRFAREWAVEGLSAFNDSEARAAIARVAASDPFVVHDEGRARYPVREAAVAALRKLDQKRG